MRNFFFIFFIFFIFNFITSSNDIISEIEKNWNEFLDKPNMYSYNEAKKIVKKFNILNSKDFKKKFPFKKYPRMSKSPTPFKNNR